MSTIVTLRLTPQEYKRISQIARIERRPISNFITATVMKEIEESYFADQIEMAQVNSDAGLVQRLKKGQRDAIKMKGKFVA